MLGKLFSLTSGAVGGESAQQTSPSIRLPPESVQEEIHTRSLLFPDTQELFHRDDQVFPLPASSALQPGSQASTYDYDRDVDFDVRDVRVIIMQDTLGNVNPSLLFDSHPGPTIERPAPVPGLSQSISQDSRRGPTSPRKGSQGQITRPLAIQPGSPQPRQGAFDRRGSIQSRNYSFAETESQRASREYREELASFSSCIFANTEVMAYKGTSTKVHVIPSDTRSAVIPSSYAADGRGSLGRSSMRSSRLAHSFTSEAAHPHITTHAHGRLADRKKILVTRLFPINLPSDDPDPAHGVTEENTGFPFPCSPDESKPKRKRPKPVPKRTPMYAVALVIPLPATPANPTNLGIAVSKPTFRASSSFNEPDAFPSSLGSGRRAAWPMSGSGYGSEFESYYGNESEDRMDFITQHWDIIMRTLSHLQSAVANSLYPMLKQADSSAPDPLPVNAPVQSGRTASSHSRRGSDTSQAKLPKQYAKLVALPPNALMQDRQTGEEVENAQLRIVTGLCATRVVTGQGRWGPWREEARWVARWAGSKEQGFFFFNLLTGFLATHTDWLQALSPVWYRRRYYQQQKAKNEEDTSLPSRTVIIANDKMAARRLIFLLSAFLPANQQLPTVRAQRPATSASFGAFSHSPPSYIVPINKEESLRRKINRRQGRAPSHTRSFSIQSQATTRSMTGIPAQLAHLSIDNQHHERRSSELFKPTNLPLAGSDLNTRKSSAATTNTVLPDDPVAHFSTMQRSINRTVRPENRASAAADDLKRSLKRVDSLGHSSHASTHSRQSSRWGSVISGLWSTRRRDSTASTSQTPDSLGQYDSPLGSPTKAISTKKDELSPLDKQVECKPAEVINGSGTHGAAESEPDTPRRQAAKQLDPQVRIPNPSGAFESPVKTSINHDDGVIDVDVQFPDYLTSFETAVSSPSSSGYLSTPGLGSGLDSFEQFSRLAIDGDAPLNVAGWLQSYHPDFALQAIPPQKGLLEQVRESLKAEPTPAFVHRNLNSDEWPTEQWVDVSSAIIADTTTFSIKRLRYRRLVKPKATAERNGGSSLNHQSPTTASPSLSPYELPVEEKFEEEELVTLDDALIDAVERVIAQTNDSSRVTSATSSRSVSKRRGRSNSEASEPEEVAPDVRLDFREVPRVECKTVVLSALGSIVQEVVEKREKESKSCQTTSYQVNREKESALRGAIRAWLDSVELGDS